VAWLEYIKLLAQVSTNKNLGVHNSIFQAELQGLLTAQFPESSRRILPPARQLHATLQSYFLKIGAETHHRCALTCPACGTPRRLLYDQRDGFEPPLGGCVAKVSYNYELLAIQGQPPFVPFWPDWRVTWVHMI
jgi:hypothetical protein